MVVFVLMFSASLPGKGILRIFLKENLRLRATFLNLYWDGKKIYVIMVIFEDNITLLFPPESIIKAFWNLLSLLLYQNFPDYEYTMTWCIQTKNSYSSRNNLICKDQITMLLKTETSYLRSSPMPSFNSFLWVHLKYKGDQEFRGEWSETQSSIW